MINQLLEQIRVELDSRVSSPRNTPFASRYDTSDVKQDSIIQIWQEIENRGLENVPITNAWLNTIAFGHNSKRKKHHLAARRSVAAERVSPDEARYENDPITNAESNEQIQHLSFAVRLLDQEQKTILKLRFFEQRSFGEIADSIDSTAQTVRRKFLATLDQLRKQLCTIADDRTTS